MFEKLLPAFEKDILSISGVLPVVFKGLERNFEKQIPEAKLNSHQMHELFYLREGKVEFIINGHPILLRKKSSILIRPQALHGIRILSESADSVVLYFGFSKPEKESCFSSNQFEVSGDAEKKKENNTKFSSKTLEDFLDFASGSEQSSLVNQYIFVSGKNSVDIGIIMERIVQEWGNTAFAQEMMIQLLTMELLLALSRALREAWEASVSIRHGKVRELVFAARDFLKENYDCSISAADAAEYVFLSKSYFTRVFKEEMGISPLAYLLMIRIAQSCILLKNQDAKVSRVASLVGFSSPQRFNAGFRKYMGITPMEFKKASSEQQKIYSKRSISMITDYCIENILE